MHLANIVRQVQQIEDEKRTIKDKKHQLRIQEQRSFQFSWYFMRNRYYAFLDHKEGMLKEKRKNLQNELLVKQNEYYYARGRRKALETLKEKQHATERKEQIKWEQQNIDELSTCFWEGDKR